MRLRSANITYFRRVGIFIFILFNLFILNGCKDYASNLSKENSDIIKYYFTKEFINECNIEIYNIDYKSNLSGQLGASGPMPDHGDSLWYQFIDETSVSKIAKSEDGTLVFYPLPTLDNFEESEKYKAFFSNQKSDISLEPLRKNVKGWVINGIIKCKYNRNKFILLDSYGDSQ
jgi:hypothetical protein